MHYCYTIPTNPYIGNYFMYGDTTCYAHVKPRPTIIKEKEKENVVREKEKPYLARAKRVSQTETECYVHHFT